MRPKHLFLENRCKLLEAVVAIGAVLVMATTLVANSAQVPGIMNYQGVLTQGGKAYTGTALLKFALVDGGTMAGRQATATAVVTSGFITSFILTDGGSHYTTPPAVTITDSTGQNATAHAIVAGGVVASIEVDSPGTGYSASPTVTIAPPGAAYDYVTYWSNDGTGAAGSEPATAVTLDVNEGKFSINLGDTTIAGMTAVLTPDIFANPVVQLRIWASTGAGSFAKLAPDQRVTSVGYSLMAAQVANSAVVQTANLADAAVTGPKLAANAVGTAQIADGVITSAKLAPGAISALSSSDGAPADIVTVDNEGRVWVTPVSGAGNIATGATGTSEALNFYDSGLSTYEPITLNFHQTRRISSGGFPPVYFYQSLDSYLVYHSELFTFQNASLAVEDHLFVTNMVSGSGSTVLWNSTSKEFVISTSSERYKENIQSWHEDAYGILKLEPKTYTRPGDTSHWEVGYIAEEADRAGLKGVTVYDQQGKPEALDYARMVLYSNEIIKDQQREIADLKRTMAELKAAVDRLSGSR